MQYTSNSTESKTYDENIQNTTLDINRRRSCGRNALFEVVYAYVLTISLIILVMLL